MWSVRIRTWSWVDIDGKQEYKKCTLNFVFDTLEEAGEFVDTVVQHSDYTEFEFEYKGDK